MSSRVKKSQRSSERGPRHHMMRSQNAALQRSNMQRMPSGAVVKGLPSIGTTLITGPPFLSEKACDQIAAARDPWWDEVPLYLLRNREKFGLPACPGLRKPGYLGSPTTAPKARGWSP